MNTNVKTRRFERLDSLFQRASQMDSGERTAFLTEACAGDTRLLSEVKGLLDSADRTLGLLKKPVDDAARQLAFSGRHIGPYVLGRLLGEGGMGSVFLGTRADQQYEQSVAIKLMHAGLWQSQAMLQRFRAERQILADLNHPHVARFLDGGMTRDGTPYFVMEYIDGTPIDQHCRKNALSIAAKLELFRRICSAVEYAHKNLIVHRDIKPGNVLVTTDGSPKLLDFGIAKLLDSDDQGQTPPKTRPTERLMTPEYASPEQLTGGPITTATDVYGLGVLLYELLAEAHPFADQIDTPVELARRICEVDPPPPSAVVLSNSPHGLSESRKLKGDLDYIVSMAMRKEPERRYSSAAALARDVSAHLCGYPVSARNNYWGYRAAKFVRRHKLLVVAAALLALSVAGFSVGMALLTQRANRERLRAESEAGFLADMFRAATPGEARGTTVTARELLDRGARRVDSELAGQSAVRASLMYSIADAYSRLGVYDRAKELAEGSYQIRAKELGLRNASTADSLFLLANATRLAGEYDKAEPLFRQAIDIRRTISALDGGIIADSISSLGECLFLEGKDVEAESTLRRALEIYQRLGGDSGTAARDYLARLLEKKGEYLEALRLLGEEVEIDKRAEGADSPAYTMALHNLAGALLRLGDLYAAEARLRESLATERRVLGSDHPDLGYSLNLLGVVALEEGDWRTAEPLLRESLGLWSKLGPTHRLLVTGLNNWARVLQAQGKYSESRRYFQRALAIAQQEPSGDTYTAARVLFNFAVLEFDTGRYSSAEELARRALAMQRGITGGDSAPDTAWTLMTLAETRVFSR